MGLANDFDLTQDRVRSILNYNPNTGLFTWKHRDDVQQKWNTRYAGKIAGLTNDAGYILIAISKKLYRAHRLAWLYVYGYLPEEVDHIDHDHANNRISNLRDVTRKANSRNLPLAANNTSGRTGVWWHKGARRWAAEIMVNKKKISLGLFDSIDDASIARSAAEYKYGFHENHGAANDNSIYVDDKAA